VDEPTGRLSGSSGSALTAPEDPGRFGYPDPEEKAVFPEGSRISRNLHIFLPEKGETHRVKPAILLVLPGKNPIKTNKTAIFL
jgi:hypothetical protein